MPVPAAPASPPGTADADAPAPAVSLRGVTVAFSAPDGATVRAVAPTDLEIPAGELVAIVGPSGCGKTSLLRVIAGLIEPSAGDARVFGAPPRQAQEAKQLGLVFQEPALLPWRDVAANIALGRQLNPSRTRGGVDIDRLINLVGLEGFRSFRPAALSGGMQQRVALARAIAIDPPLLLLDEPFAALDEITREQMRYELLRLWTLDAGGHRADRSAVFVTHSVSEAVAVGDRVIVMSHQPGEIVADIPISRPHPRWPAQERTPGFHADVEEVRRALREQQRLHPAL